MSPEHRHDGGLPRGTRQLSALPGNAPAAERWAGANEAKAEKLRLRALQRRAGGRGYQLRHSEYGYALIDSARKPVDDRNDLSLDEVESWIERPLEA
ncbi:MAG TPA: hypothetical protein VJ814_01240 [Gaiellaceae bacterium]|nr:hypothetical protein [Gaiellaceae bacterium]